MMTKTYEEENNLRLWPSKKLNKGWVKGNKLKTSTEFNRYKFLVKSTLLYNCGIWALTLIACVESVKESHCHYILSAHMSLFGYILRKTKTFLQIKLQELILSIPNGNKLQGRQKTLPIVFNRDLAPNQTTLKQRPGRDHKTSTGQNMLEEINITDRETCRRVTD